MSTKHYLQLKVLLLGDHGTGKTCYLTTLRENCFPGENTFFPSVADSFTLDLQIPDASPLEDPCAWQSWRDSDGRRAGDARKSERQHTHSTKRGVTVAPWDIVPRTDSNERLRPLAYPNTDAITLCFSVVHRGSFCSIGAQVFSYYIIIFFYWR